MSIEEFIFPFKTANIAQHPHKRGNSKLLILSRPWPHGVRHGNFKDIIYYLNKGDVLVLNNSKVISTRLWGMLDGDKQREITLVQRLAENIWTAYIRPAIDVRPGSFIAFCDRGLKARIISKYAPNIWRLRLFIKRGTLYAYLNRHAEINLPFYLRFPLKNKTRYQTIFAKAPGSCQPPTAGLHFTHRLLNKLRTRGVVVAYVTLHVSGGILPMRARSINKIRIEKEECIIPRKTVREITKAQQRGNKIIAVGTTVVRALESVANHRGRIIPYSGWVDLSILPGYTFKVVNAFLTNFHLPGSSHLLLTCAFGGKERVLNSYKEALSREYGFLDFGDAMFII